MATRKNRATMELGHDAFLDVVANLVGILIILVVILGSQSTAMIKEIKEQNSDSVSENSQYATDEQLAELSQQAMRAASAQADSNRFEELIRQYGRQLDMKRQQRAILIDLLSEATAAWEERKLELDQEATLAAQRSSEYQLAQQELEKLEGERRRLEDQPEATVAVEHLPTPMARTVFGDELHFRLKGNRLSVVPIERLLEEIRNDFERVATQLTKWWNGIVGRPGARLCRPLPHG